MYTHPIKLEIGVCSANPKTKEINPKDTTAVYQFTNSTEMMRNASTNAKSKRKIRLRLNREAALRTRAIA